MKCLADSLKYFSFVSHICSFKLYEPFSIPCLAVMFVIAKYYEVFTEIHK